MAELVVANFNVHGGVDGWGRPFDVVAACLSLGADLLVLEENWAPEDGDSLAARVATAGGYELHEAALSHAIMFRPAPNPGRGWDPGHPRGRSRALFVGDPSRLARVRQRRPEPVTLGTWGIAVLSRPKMTSAETIELGRLRRDRAELRAAVSVEVDLAGSRCRVVGTHMAHFVHGSPLLMGRLRQHLPAAGEAGVLAGDMNFWGPPVTASLPHWRRAVRARTYPAWRPHSQIDHILVTEPVRVLDAGALAVEGSDHRPVRARLAFD